MKIGICVATHVGNVDYIVRAEELGDAAAWLADSQMLWSDCYAVPALAVTRTERIADFERYLREVRPAVDAACVDDTELRAAATALPRWALPR